jgi:serine/threonine protein kinase
LLIQQRYRLLEAIGQGGFGKTFLAVDEGQSPPSPCVIKQLLPQNQISIEAQNLATLLFQQEAQRLKDLGKHVQIPALLAHFEEDQHLYLVQEFIQGINLAKALEEEGYFSEAQIWQLLDDLLPVLKFIHDHKVIHRDIKPENIIHRNSDSRFVLVDFGAAKLVRELDQLKIGTLIGSPEYVAPEQAKGKAIFASDLYSLGVTCIYLLTGIRPFDLFDIANDCWIWRQYLTDAVSERLTQILDKLLQNAVNRRFQSADEVLLAINFTHIRYPSNILTQNSKLKTQNCKWQCQHTLSGHSGLFASVNAVAISPDGHILASASDDKTIRLWNLNTGQAISTLSGHSHFVKAVAFSPDGKILASSSDDKTIKLWDLNTKQEIYTFSGHSHAVKSVAFSPCGKLLASGSWDKKIKLWDINTFAEICTFSGHGLQVSAVAFSPDGQLIASTSFDRTVQLWNLNSSFSSELFPRLDYTFKGHAKSVFAVAFSPNGSILATGSDDNTIQLWNLSNGEAIRTISGHSWSVVAVAFSSDGETLISGSWDKTIKLWNVKTGQEIATLLGHIDSVYGVAISLSAQIIASGSRDKTIKIWQLIL